MDECQLQQIIAAENYLLESSSSVYAILGALAKDVGYDGVKSVLEMMGKDLQNAPESIAKMFLK